MRVSVDEVEWHPLAVAIGQRAALYLAGYVLAKRVQRRIVGDAPGKVLEGRLSADLDSIQSMLT